MRTGASAWMTEHVKRGQDEDYAANNKKLGNFRLDGIPPLPRGAAEVTITFNIDADGILSASCPGA